VGKTKVLFFLPSATGGAERVTVTIAKMLPRNEYEVKFVIVHKSLGTIVQFIPEGYEVIHIPIANIYCFTTLKMIRVIREEKPDFVFSSLIYLNSRVIAAAKVCGVKSIVRNNIDLSRGKQGLLNGLLIKSTYKWADRIIAQQEEMHDEIVRYTEVAQEKVITLHNPIDEESIREKAFVDSPYDADSNETKYVWVGRFSEEKGQDLIVRAMEIVKKKVSNAHLYLVGEYNWNNGYDRSIKEFVESHGLTDCVHFVGFDNNPYRWVNYCDCYVMPSRLEGLPNSLIEAMYLHKPVVATKCIPVVSRIVKDGYNGILAETENVDSIAAGMVAALELKDFEMTYHPASEQEFRNLFTTNR